MKSDQIVFTEPRKVELRQINVPDPAPNEVTVQTLVSLVSTGTESFTFRGEFDADTGWAAWVKYPFEPGYSNVARVIKLGKDVTALREGDRAVSTSPHRQFINVAVGTRDLTKVPDDVTDEDAAWAILAYIAQTAVRRAEHAMGDAAAVIGLGPVGQLAVQFLNVIGLREILAIDPVQMRLDLALKHGATHAFPGSAADAGPFVKAHTEEALADAVYDATGHYAVFPLALKLARNFGTVLLLGDSPHPSKQHLTHDVLARQLKVLGTHNAKLPPQHAHWTGSTQMKLFFRYLQRGRIRVDDLITHRFNPHDAADVYDLLEQHRDVTMGVLFDWRR